jgi:hypothetical protein
MLLDKNLDRPDERRSFEHGDLDVVTLGQFTFSRAVLRPGWRWSEDIKPIAGTGSCQLAHQGVVVSGRFHVQMDDGQARDLGPGDAHVVSPGHDAWVLGDEPCVIYDFAPSLGGARTAARPCGVTFHVDSDDALDHLVAAVQEHARGSHDHDVTRDHILSELTLA